MLAEPDTDVILNELKEFKKIGLDKFNKIRLPFRTDTKYVTKLKNLDIVLADLKRQYLLLEINGQVLSRYETEYYDTNSFSFYLMHHNGKLNRFKVRRRTYLASGLSYLEVKLKNNKGRTIKKRKRLGEGEVVLNEGVKSFIEKYTSRKTHELNSKIVLNYLRIALADRDLRERVSIDLDLTFNNNKQSGALPNLVIIEVKQNKHNKNSYIMKVLRRHRIKPFRLSKYCLGVCHLYDYVKKNRLKEKMIILKKQLH